MKKMKQVLNILFLFLFMVSMAGFGCDNKSYIVELSSITPSRAQLDYTSYNAEEMTGQQLAPTRQVISTKFVDSYEFARTAGVDVKEVDGYPVAGIVNHHSLAMDLQARFFKSLKASRPDIDKFVIISPDHFLAGDLVSTHGFGYSTPSGEVESLALEAFGIYQAKDVKVFANEHGVGVLAPFIAREFSGAVITSVYIRPEATPAQLQKLGQEIAKQINEQTFVIISSDMSHYLPDREARENDEMTLGWIESNDWEKLESANDDYTDSAQGFVVLEAFLESLEGNIEFQLLDHAISTDYGADSIETTSYLNGFYTIKK